MAETGNDRSIHNQVPEHIFGLGLHTSTSTPVYASRDLPSITRLVQYVLSFIPEVPGVVPEGFLLCLSYVQFDRNSLLSYRLFIFQYLWHSRFTWSLASSSPADLKRLLLLLYLLIGLVDQFMVLERQAEIVKTLDLQAIQAHSCGPAEPRCGMFDERYQSWISDWVRIKRTSILQ